MGEDARVVLGKYKDEGHAWVILFKDNKSFLLEATSKTKVRRHTRYPLAYTQIDYHPIIMFNRDTYWLNTGSEFTTVYDDKKWVKKSQYQRPANS
jgi:hypothetical protein